MNRTFSPSLVRPALPLRRPSSSPGLMTPSILSPAINNKGTSLAQERSLSTGSPKVIAEGSRNEKGWMSVGDSSPDGLISLRSTQKTPMTLLLAQCFFGPLLRAGPMSAPVTVNLCNYCSKQGILRCTHCQKTYYCSVPCQTEDWKAHRHVCKLSTPEHAISDKPKESLTLSCVNGAGVLESKASNIQVVELKRVYLQDLRKNNISKGDEFQASIVEMRTPGKFFVHIKSVEMTETLNSIALNLQNTYSGSLASAYEPEIGEICAVKFSFDQNWYRGEILSVDFDHHTAKVLYIDFGNEEDVAFGQIRNLSVNIDAAPPCAPQCCIAGVTAITSSWTGESCIALRRLVAGKSLTFTVVDVLNNNTLLAVDATLSTLGKNLSSFLIEQGCAIKDTSPGLQIKQDIDSLMRASFENFKCLSFGKNENIEAELPEPLSQKVGDTFTVIVTHLQSPSEIVCQKIENARVIQQLQRNLREHCAKIEANENFRPAPGTVCCSLFSEDNQWYRAKVLAYSTENQVCVGYVDFGNSEEVSLNHLRPISMALLALATQAIPCALAGIKPFSGAWTEEIVVTLKQLVCNRFIRVEILGERDGTALVSMVDESSDPQTNAAELLVATGYAVEGSMETTKEVAVKSGSTDCPVNKLKWSCAELPSDGQNVVLVISVLESPSQFYCYNYKAEDLKTLADLSSALIKHCEADTTPFNPAVGEPCCAVFSDGSWCRSIVQSLEGDGNAKVYFVDYGNTCKVQASHLRAIKPSLLTHPFQAICCSLAGIEPIGEEWSKEAVDKFQTLCLGKRLNARVLSVTEKGYGVELECSGQNIATVLISEQLAKPSELEYKSNLQAATLTQPTEASPTPVPDESHSGIEQPAITTGQKPVKPLSSTLTTLFPLDWKSVELPRNETFQALVAAVTNPSLFYVLNPREASMLKMRRVVADVMMYCSKQTQPNQCMPLPGAACCAQFSGDANWYRAVVFEITSTSATVIYADYGNMEKIPITSILPIPKALLQYPFEIARCALSGKEHFPTVWPPEVLELFGVQMSGKVLVSVDHVDGNLNLLNVIEHSTPGGSNVNSVILGALKSLEFNTKTQIQDARGQGCVQSQAGSTSSVSADDLSADAEMTKPQNHDKENMNTTVAIKKKEDLLPTPNSAVTSIAPTSCCCASLERKIAQIEELLLLLVDQMGGKSRHT